MLAVLALTSERTRDEIARNILRETLKHLCGKAEMKRDVSRLTAIRRKGVNSCREQLSQLFSPEQKVHDLI